VDAFSAEVGTPSIVMQVLKQRAARALLPKRKPRNPRQRNLFGDEPERRAFWQARFYDSNVWTTKQRVEKLRYMHRNNVLPRISFVLSAQDPAQHQPSFEAKNHSADRGTTPKIRVDRSNRSGDAERDGHKKP
jgi:hypothetical protein